MKNIHILPTDKPSRLSIRDIDNKLCIHRPEVVYHGINQRGINQNIYITSDEEIKEGDWYLNIEEKNGIKNPFYGKLYKANQSIKSVNADYKHNLKKIILTTDQDLIKDGVWGIEDGFLEWFVKNPTCEYVELKGYAIILPSENEEEVVDGLTMGQIPSNEEPTSCACGANTSCQCEEPKEKTFEEILSKMTLVNPKHLRMTSNGHGEFPDGYMLTEDGVKYIVKQLKNK